MNLVISLIMRQMRAPFIVLITVLSISVLGMVLIPGIDDNGNPWRMDFFHALYFVSYTATTIGFGEIPYPLTDAQRFWVLITIFISVISWFYAIGKIVSLIQTPLFKKAVTESTFRRSLQQINGEFYLVCGYGETGTDLVEGLAKKDIRTVVIDEDTDAINRLLLQDYKVYVPGIQADAQIPDQIINAGLDEPNCQGVIAVTDSDDTNLKIAIISKLLHPGLKVICRSEHKANEVNMKSFDTDYTVNPYDTFAASFALTLRSPALYLLNEWLTGVPETKLNEPLNIEKGHWVLCGYGRLGRRLYKTLKGYGLSVTIIDPSAQLKEEFKAQDINKGTNFIVGTGTDALTLQQAGVIKAVGLIAGSDNDSNNLSIIMTAQMINTNLVIIARQNEMVNKKLFIASQADIIMHPSEIVARRIRTLLTNPLLIEFLNVCYKQDIVWANIAISRLSGSIGDVIPHCWTSKINTDDTPALYDILKKGRPVKLKHILQDPRLRQKKLVCMPLMVKRGYANTLLPDDDFVLQTNDKILFCGLHEAEVQISYCMRDIHTLNYVMTFKHSPDSYIGRLLHGDIIHEDRRQQPRTKRSRLHK